MLSLKSLLKNSLIVIFLAFGQITLAQTTVPPNVDVKQVPQSQIQQAEKAIKDAGLSTNEAIELARQKGATEQQIKDFQDRLAKNPNTTEVTNNNPTQAATESVQELENSTSSKRTADFNNNGQIFGSYLFNSKNLTFEPSLKIQTPKNYTVGIGDQLIINIWGNSQSNYQLAVDLNGQINIPNLGPIYVAGLSFESATQKIIERLSSIYVDMAGPAPSTFAQVNMGQLRSIKVNLLGEVVTPGSYTLPVTATVFNALYLSGGPNTIGSFRNIKIIRDNKVFKIVDIYKFLVNADPTDNIILKDEDIIFVPAVEKRVNVNGTFKRNGLFELKEGEGLNELIRFAGGYSDDSYLARLQIRRKTQQGMEIRDVPFASLSSAILENGDEVRNDKILDVMKNRVTISGAIIRPGEYEWHQGMTLNDLIIKADDLTPDVFKNRGIITRLNDDLTTTNIPFDVEAVASGKTNIELMKEDEVIIQSHFLMKETPDITVAGDVLRPGKFPYSENITVSDAVFMVGGFKESADSTYIEVSRRLDKNEAANMNDQLLHTYTLNLARDLKIKETGEQFILKPYDRVYIRRAPGYRDQASAKITGEVKFAGMFSISNRQQRISDLVKLAGGFTNQAFLDGATLARNTSELGYEKVGIELKKIIEKPGCPEDLYLRDGDSIDVPTYAQTVKIVGQVQNPFSVTYYDKKALKYYISKSGGFSSNAVKKKTYVRYPDGTSASTKGFLFKRYPRIKPGSEIIVPAKPERKEGDNTMKWISIASVLSSLAVSVATIVNLTN